MASLLVAAVAFSGPAVRAQSFHETAGVRLIRVDLAATDRDGRPILGLKSSEIQLRVDGHPVAVESLDTIEPAPAPAPLRAAVPETPRAAVSRAPAAQTVAARAPALSLAILIDETSISPFSKKSVEGTLSSFLSGPLAADVEVLVERFDGTLHVECPWTGDVALARAAAKRILQRSFVQVLPSPGDFGNPDGAIVSDDITYFSGKALAGVYQALLLFPETAAGRRALVWVTDGTPLLSPQSLARYSQESAANRKAPLPGAPQWLVAQRTAGPLLDRAAPSIREETLGGWGNLIQRMATKALQRDIAIMPVSAQPVDAGLFLGDAAVGAEGARRQAANLPSFTTRSDVVHGMTGIGEVTGGEATLLGGHLDRDLRRAVARRSSGYVLTFRDPSPQDPRVHDIEIAVSRPDVRLRYRRGFQTLDPLTQLADRVVSNLYVPRPVNPLQATVAAAVLERKLEILTVRLTVTFPPLPEAGGLDTRHRTLQIVGACLGPRGEATAPFQDTGGTRTVYQDDKPLLERSLVVHMRPGTHTWSLGVRDQETGLTSYLSFTTAL